MLKSETKKKRRREEAEGDKKRSKGRKRGGGICWTWAFFLIYLKSCCLEDAVDMFHSVG